ncbi:Polynucleotide 5'-hydroxyl-kinase grc3, partial [Tulasnella sp. 418]
MLSAIAARRAQAQAAPGPDIELDKVPIGSKSKAHGLSKQKRKREVSQNAVSGRSTPISVQPQYPSAITIVARDAEAPVDLDSTHQGTSKRQRAYSPSQIPIQSDSDLESEGMSDIEVILNPGPSNQLPNGSSSLFISRYSPKFGQNLFTGILSGTIIILRPEEFLGFVGIVEVNVVQGIIEALGTRITDSQPYTIFAPRSHPFPTIRALVSSASTKYALFNEIPQSLKDCIQPDDTVLLLRNHNCGIGGLGTVCKIFDSIFQPSVASTQNEEIKLGVDGFYPILKPMPNVYPFIMPDSWSSVLEEIATSTDSAAPSQQHIVAIVKGAKRSGKSTFARTLLNRLLSKYRHVAFLECDVGQSEFTPGGMVSLHVIAHPLLGPSFTHPTRPYRAHFIGSSSPKSSPSHYMASIANLVQTYKMDLQYGLYNMNEQDARDARISTTIPLVVNTQGWAKGMGADLLEEIASLVQPTHEISFDLDPAMDQFGMRSMPMFEVEAPRQGSWAETPDYSQFRSSSQGVVPPKRFVLQPIPITPLSNLFSASDLRSLSIFSYLYARSTEDGYDREDIIWSAPTPLVKMPPYEVEWKTAIDAVVLVGQGAEEV